MPQLVPLMLSYIVDFYGCPSPGERNLEGLARRLMAYPDFGIQFVAADGDVLTGFATLYFTFSTLRAQPVAILNDLFVRSESRGQKIGESLFRHCLAYIRARGFASMQWETASDNRVARALYEKMGGRAGDWIVYEMDGSLAPDRRGSPGFSGTQA